MSITTTIDTTCPECGSPLDQHTSTTEDVSPGVGDWSICLMCEHVLRVRDQARRDAVDVFEKPRRPNALANPDAIQLIRVAVAIRSVKASGGRK